MADLPIIVPVSNLASLSPFSQSYRQRIGAMEEATARFAVLERDLRVLLAKPDQWPGGGGSDRFGLYLITAAYEDQNPQIQHLYDLQHIGWRNFGGTITGIPTNIRPLNELETEPLIVGSRVFVCDFAIGQEDPVIAIIAAEQAVVGACPPGGGGGGGGKRAGAGEAGGSIDPALFDYVLAAQAAERWVTITITAAQVAAFGATTTGTLTLFTLAANEIIQEFTIYGPGITLGMGTTLTMTIGHDGDGGTFAADVDWWVASMSLQLAAFTSDVNPTYALASVPLLRYGAHPTTAIAVKAYLTGSVNLSAAVTGPVTIKMKLVKF